MKREIFSLADIYAAYIDCRKRKRNSKSCAEFELNEAENIYSLYRDLNNGTYTIGKSIAFCVTRPKIREVFAACFRDRIVHHLLILKYGDLLEKYFIDDTYNCRKGKGTLYGHNRALELSKEYSDGWVLSLDISGFFMSIVKKRLANRLEIFLRKNYKRNDLEAIVQLTLLVINHRPELNCEKRGDLSLWDKLARSKSLFYCSVGLGMAIGNLTSQIFANFYMAEFDLFMVKLFGNGYQRYVDDLKVYSHSHKALLKGISIIRNYLKKNLGLRLNSKKIELQPINKGFNFIGATIKIDRIYISKRTVGNFQIMLLYYSKNPKVSFVANMERFVCKYNSYSGFLCFKKTFAIRYRLWNLVHSFIKQFVYINENKSCIRLRTKYTIINRYKERKYDLQHVFKRRLQKD